VLSSLFVLASVSKVPFYIAGGALAAWAVLLSAFALNRPGFPSGSSGQRGVIAISLVLVVITVAMAIHTSTFE
jgi:hypothetical protein